MAFCGGATAACSGGAGISSVITSSARIISSRDMDRRLSSTSSNSVPVLRSISLVAKQ